MTAANELNKLIVDVGNMRGGALWRNNTGMLRGGGGRLIAFGRKGSGDVVGCYRGYFVSIETKVGRDRASADQLEFADWINDRGGFAIFAHGLEDAERLFDRLDILAAEVDSTMKRDAYLNSARQNARRLPVGA